MPNLVVHSWIPQNKTHQERQSRFPKMDCIWMIPSLDLLRMLWFSIAIDAQWQWSVPEFNDKVIIDFWAGVSDFCNTVSQLSTPKRLVAIDIMYQGDEFYNEYVAITRSLIAEKVRDLHAAIKNDKDVIWDWNYDGITELYQHVWNRLKRQVKILSNDSHHNTSVEKYTSINEMQSVWECDFVFATHVLFSMSDRLYWLALISMMLSSDGKICVTDYDRRNNVSDCTFVLRREIELGNTGIYEIVTENGDACFEITQLWAVIAYRREQWLDDNG